MVQEGAAQDLRAGQLPHGERAGALQREEHRVDGAEADRAVRPAAAAALPPHHEAHAAPHLEGGVPQGAEGGLPPQPQRAQDRAQAHHAQVVHAQEAARRLGLQGAPQLPAAAAALAAVRAVGAAPTAAAADAVAAGAVAPALPRASIPCAAVPRALEETHSGPSLRIMTSPLPARREN